MHVSTTHSRYRVFPSYQNSSFMHFPVNFHYFCPRQQSSASHLHTLVSPILKFHLNEVIQFELFYVWLLSLSKMLLRFIHVVWICQKIVPFNRWVVFHCMTIPHFMHSLLMNISVDEHFSYIQLKAIISKIISIHMHASFCMNCSSSGVCLVFPHD